MGHDRRHRSAAMRTLIEARPWPAVFRLPSYPPELNPAEGVWSALERALAHHRYRNLSDDGEPSPIPRSPQPSERRALHGKRPGPRAG
ncbi:transposase [Streptosporangium sp. CA-135522]|uniref:transposase n=1 Tax=Streptosporangium sp. CA-135522 TaxID=3240072 RepID=UPI003D941CE8